MNTLVDMISGMEAKEDDDDFLNAVGYMFKGLEQQNRVVLRWNSIRSTGWPEELYALGDFLIKSVGKSPKTYYPTARRKELLNEQ